MSKRIALVGMPNTGKSTLFNRLTGAGAKVGNWPGLTVELLSARLLLGDGMVELVDLPGLHNLHGFSEDERVARRFVETQPLNGILVVLNTTQLERQLALVLQMKSLGLPMFLALNMADEAKHRGIRVRTEHLEAQLGMPVRLISAKHGQGVPELKQALTAWLREHPQTTHASAIALTEDDVIEDTLNDILSDSLHIPICLSPTRTDRVDQWLLHPWLGIPLFLLIMLAVFQVVYGIGSPLQEGLGWLLDEVKTLWLAPMVAGLPAWASSFLLEGLFDGVGTVLTFLPIIGVFFLAMAVIEDSGYLARAAFLMDAMMSRFGLDGRAFVMQIMGLGCNVPAIMGTRIMRSPALRALTMLIIPFSLCSARLQVILFVVAAVFSASAAPAVIFSLYVLSFAMAFLTAWLMKRRYVSNEPLLLEMPPLRLPTWRFLGHESWRAMGQFLRGAGGFIIIGVVLVWFLTHVPFDAEPASADTLAGQLALGLAPVFAPLGIDHLLSVALLFGFVAKEIVIGALSVIYAVSGDELSTVLGQRLDWVQAYSFLLFTLIYTPCVSTIATLRSESGSDRVMWASLAWSLGAAWLLSFAFYQTARMLTQ
jgi:ferrous iron transport protein B